MGFLRKVKVKTVKVQWGGTWRRASVVIFFKEEGTQILGAYIDKLQMAEAYWLDLIPIYEVCDRGGGYKVRRGAVSRCGGKLRLGNS